MTRKILLSLAIAFGFFYVFFIHLIPESLIMVFKLIPMFLIILLAFSTQVNSLTRTYKTFIVIALIFCTVGDYTIQWFVIGLSCFLVGHIFYIRAFLSSKRSITPIWMTTLLILFGLVMLIWIGGTVYKSGNSVLTLAVCIYMLVILLMGYTSYQTGSKYAVIGAMLFIVSDSILAINKFVMNIEFSHQLIMVTYYGAQILLALSIAKYSAIRSKNDTIKEV